MSCCNNKHPHHPNKFIDVTCAKPKPWDEVPALLGLNECGNIVPTEKPEYELSEEDREKLDGMVTDGDGKKALFNDGTYKEVYTKEQSDAITEGLEERIAQNADAIADNAGAIDDLRNEVADNYLALAGNSEQTSITGDVYTAARIVARQNSPEGTQYRVMIDGTEAGYERFGSSMAQTDLRSAGRPTVNTSNEIAYLSEVEAVQEEVYISVTNLTEAIHTVQENLDSAVEDLSDSIQQVQQNVEGVASDLSALAIRVDATEAGIEENATSLTDLRTATESAFETVHASLDSLDERVTNNEADIALHTSDIEALREDLASRELFRGYYETTGEITAIENPAEGNYAWNAETGTVWLYNGTTWVDSTIRIPDQTVEAYDALPRMDGEGDAGSTNRYARGDHQHPSDDSKADLTELDNYLSLEGNTQASRMTGDLWMATGQMVRLTNSGKSGLRQNADENVTELVSNGVGGIHLIAPNGTVKYNGEEIAIKSDLTNATTDISELQSAVETNTGNIAVLQSDVAGHTQAISVLQNTTSENVEDITVLQSAVAENTDTISELQTTVSQNIIDIVEIQTHVTNNTEDVAGLQTTVSKNSEAILTLQSDIADNTDAIQANATSLSDLQAATEVALDTVNASLDNLDQRATRNEADIALNVSEIEALRDDLASRELFRGYYEATTEITAIENPVEGNYAWNAETGTVWLYNGTTWADSEIKIPDQTVEAYDALPRMDGEGDAGSTNRYARGDHQHPSDDSKADLTELDNYLSLEGNTQASRMTGDLWMATGQMVRLTNSGKSGLRQNADENVTELVSNGVGGIHLIAPNGTVKYNGEEIAIKSDLTNATTDISELQSAVETNTGNIAALQSDMEDNANGISALQSAVSKNAGDILVLRSDVEDNSTEINEVATVVSQHIIEIQNNASDIAAHTSDIASIREELASQEHFRGYLATTTEITAIHDPKTGDYAYNAETGTRWAYNGATWYDTQDLIPDQTVEAYDGLPLIDGEASKGLANQYARGDHRHPTDTSRASAAELTTTNLALSGLQTEVSGYQSANDANISALQTEVAVNEAQISSLTDRVATQETTIYTLTGDVATHTAEIANLTSRVDSGKTHIGTLQTQTAQLGKDLDKLSVEVADIDSRVLTNKNDIATLQSQYNEQEHFRGFYLSTVEVTSLKAKAGDYAWNSETGTVWVYDIEIPSWTDSGVAIPVQAVFAATAFPLQDGVASAGESSDYARGDHRHPTDNTRASVKELTESNNRIAVLETSAEDHEIRISGLEEDSSTHNSDISALQISVSDQQDRVTGLETQANDHADRIASLEEDVTIHTSDIQSVADRTTTLEEMSAGHDSDISALQTATADHEERIAELESGNSDLSNVVTLDSTQEITGTKIFTNAIWAERGVYTNSIMPMDGALVLGSLNDEVRISGNLTMFGHLNAADAQNIASFNKIQATKGEIKDLSVGEELLVASGNIKIGDISLDEYINNKITEALENALTIKSIADRTSTLESQINGYTLLMVTQDEFDAITAKEPNTIYYVKEE
ncbi:MAG: hypothetical protein LUF85_06585 [Bacteroides sp.]|nr:hypothetical protein [Bacteroides sp.]